MALTSICLQSMGRIWNNTSSGSGFSPGLFPFLPVKPEAGTTRVHIDSRTPICGIEKPLFPRMVRRGDVRE